MTGDGQPPADSNVVTQTGPWTVLSCVTAVCSWCGTVPLDEDTGLTPHFADIAQAREELPLNWGWTVVPGRDWPKDDELLCPECAKADDGGPASSSASPRPWMPPAGTPPE